VITELKVFRTLLTCAVEIFSGELLWLWPLIVLVAELIVVTVVIVLSEIHRRRQRCRIDAIGNASSVNEAPCGPSGIRSVLVENTGIFVRITRKFTDFGAILKLQMQ
jgi:hypothetical protein